LLGKPIELAAIEGVPEAALGDPRDSGGRGRRAEELKREHSRRLSEKKQKYVKRDETRGEASTEPVTRQEPKPSAEPRSEKRDDRPREKRSEQRARDKRREPQAREKRPEPQARDKRSDAPRQDKEQRPPREERGGVQGFGDNAPAFLKRKP
jgi:hypothetical protein